MMTDETDESKVCAKGRERAGSRVRVSPASTLSVCLSLFLCVIDSAQIFLP